MRVTRGKGFAKDPCSIPVEERPELCTLLLEGRHSDLPPYNASS